MKKFNNHFLHTQVVNLKTKQNKGINDQWANICIKDLARYLTSVKFTPQKICLSVYPPREIPAQTIIPPPQKLCLLRMLGQLNRVFCSHQTSTRPELFCNVNWDSSISSIEIYCCLVQETCSLAQCERALHCRPFKGIHANGRLACIFAL